MEKIKVAVLFGGRSGEHEISLASSSSIIEGLDKDKYEIIPVFISKEGKWINPSESFRLLKKLDLLHSESEVKFKNSATSHESFYALAMEQKVVDVVIPALHGTFGEDGTIQGMLEIYDVPYLGSEVMASAVAMDKAMMKNVFKAIGLPVCDSITLKRKDWETDKEEKKKQIQQEIGYPLFVKPANLGSSIGISKVINPEGLQEACDIACRYDRKIIIEEGINAREIECSVLGNDDPIASVPGEIIPKNEFYDYDSKYTPGKMELIVPAPVDEDKINEIQSLSLKAFEAAECCGMARIDFLMDKESQKIYISEINTIPGFTSTSVYSKLFEASGIKYGDLLDRLINLAIERFKDKRSSETRYI